MANPTISQIKINDTIYDLCDFDFRSHIKKWHRKYKNPQSSVTVPAMAQTTCYWDHSDIPSDYEFWGYLEYDTNSIYVYPVTINHSAMVLFNRQSSRDSTVTPHAFMLYTSPLLDA